MSKGVDLTELERLEADNEERVKRLLSLGMPEAFITITAIGTRLGVVINVLQSAGLDMGKFELEYEEALASALDEVLVNVTAPQLFVPNAGR